MVNILLYFFLYRELRRWQETWIPVSTVISVKVDSWVSVSNCSCTVHDFPFISFLHLKDNLIQSDLRCIQGTHFIMGIEPTLACSNVWATGMLFSAVYCMSVTVLLLHERIRYVLYYQCKADHSSEQLLHQISSLMSRSVGSCVPEGL